MAYLQSSTVEKQNGFMDSNSIRLYFHPHVHLDSPDLFSLRFPHKDFYTVQSIELSISTLERRCCPATVSIFTVPRRDNFTLLFNRLLMLDQELDQLGAYCDKGHIKI